jgi:hypothetical protein
MLTYVLLEKYTCNKAHFVKWPVRYGGGRRVMVDVFGIYYAGKQNVVNLLTELSPS